MDIFTSAAVFIAVICLILLVGFAVLILNTAQYPSIIEFADEAFFTDPRTKKKIKFPSIKDPPSLTLSLIVPAYNEEERLRPMLEECTSFLEEKAKQPSFKYEIIIVDDGSGDRTSKVGLEYSTKFTADKVRVLTLHKNRGKGGAVRLGMLRARGEFLLFADADGATKFSDYDKVVANLRQLCAGGEKDLSENFGLVCGSRAHMEEESVATRSLFRSVLMWGFHFLVASFAVRTVRDTQCGFKLLTRRTARVLFGSLHVERWAFDVEMLFMAQSLGIPIGEVAVNWTEIEGSKVTPVISWIQMGLDLMIIWARYKLGVWKIRGDYMTT